MERLQGFGEIDFAHVRISILTVRLMHLLKPILTVALILPVDVLAQVNPRDINDFNVEPLPHHTTVAPSPNP